MKIIQYYAQGARHIASSQPCEDRAFSKCANGVTVIALADGAGSSKYTHSAVGAECVTETICNFFCNNFDKFYETDNESELSKVTATICQHALKQQSDELKLDSITKMSSTLLCVAIKDNKAIVCHIGDGVIGKLTKNGVEVISKPENGEFASTTYFIASPDAEKHIRIKKFEIKEELAFFLMSDGVSEYVYNENDGSLNNGAFQMSLMAFEENGEESLAKTIDNFMIKGDSVSDDCSFICASIVDELPPELCSDSKKTEVDKNAIETAKANPGNAQAIAATEVNNAIQNFNQSAQQSAQTQALRQNDNNRHNQKAIIAIAVAVVLVCAIAVTALTVSSSKSKHDTKPSKNSSSVSESTKENHSASKRIETQTVPDESTVPSKAPSTRPHGSVTQRSRNQTSSSKRDTQPKARNYASRDNASKTREI